MSNALPPTRGGDPPGGILILMCCVPLSGCRRSCSDDPGPSDEELLRALREAIRRVEQGQAEGGEREAPDGGDGLKSGHAGDSVGPHGT